MTSLLVNGCQKQQRVLRNRVADDFSLNCSTPKNSGGRFAVTVVRRMLDNSRSAVMNHPPGPVSMAREYLLEIECNSQHRQVNRQRDSFDCEWQMNWNACWSLEAVNLQWLRRSRKIRLERDGCFTRMIAGWWFGTCRSVKMRPKTEMKRKRMCPQLVAGELERRRNGTEMKWNEREESLRRQVEFSESRLEWVRRHRD